MAIVSRRSQLEFNPKPEGDDFESRINRIITPGSGVVDPDFLASTRPPRPASVASDRHPPVNRVNLYSRVDHFSRSGTRCSNLSGPATVKSSGDGRPESGQKNAIGEGLDFDKKMREKYAEELDKYYYWVDDQGRPLQEIPAVEPEPERVGIASRAATPAEVRRERTEKAKRRSQHIWRKVNPGYVKVLYTTPNTTYQDKHKWDDSNDVVHKEKDWSNHLCKTDFSDFIEEDARQTQFAKNQAGR